MAEKQVRLCVLYELGFKTLRLSYRHVRQILFHYIFSIVNESLPVLINTFYVMFGAVHTQQWVYTFIIDTICEINEKDDEQRIS